MHGKVMETLNIQMKERRGRMVKRIVSMYLWEISPFEQRKRICIVPFPAMEQS